MGFELLWISRFSVCPRTNPLHYSGVSRVCIECVCVCVSACICAYICVYLCIRACICVYSHTRNTYWLFLWRTRTVTKTGFGTKNGSTGMESSGCVF